MDASSTASDASRTDATVADATQPDAAQPSDAEAHHAVLDASQLDAAPDGPGAAGAIAKDAAAPDSGPSDSGPVGEDSGADIDSGAGDSGTPEPTFALRIVTVGLEAPWEVTWGPDDHLWITERIGKRVIRVNPSDGTKTIALTVADAYQAAGQDGVLGMALDPRLGQGTGGDYVYLAYTYDADAGTAVDRRAKLVRYSYDAGAQTLGAPLVLIEGMPASSDHNSGRLAVGPDNRLYYTIGDQGNNQFDNMCKPIRAQDLPTQLQIDQQDWSAYQGKILRLALDGSIPSDNPTLGGVKSHIYTYGHRNAQGIVFGPDGKLYASEQGPKTDDEINLLSAGKNYGWPQVAGYQDDKAYVYGNWSASAPPPCANLSYSDYEWPSSVPETKESQWSSPDFIPPIKTFYTVDNGFNFMDPACPDPGDAFICWPTIAPSSLDIYVAGNDALQSWGTSLLVTSLKTGSVFRVRLGADGVTAVGDAVELFKTTNRYRDIAIAPDKRKFYVITDSEGSTSGPTSGSTVQLEDRGAILEFSYAP
jgi:PQQ-dependent dehydrogenase (s-GDH family)